MRTEKEMFDLIIGTAQNDERIRAVYMNGSRTNPAVPKDIFQDYDIVYVVTETDSFIKDRAWTAIFGDLRIIQEPDKTPRPEQAVYESYGYLMLFMDGNRIDLHIETIDRMQEEYGKDKLTVPLLDKDHILSAIPAPSDVDYRAKKPTETRYSSCCNDFWWCLQNVAKGIWRDELPYAKQMFEGVVRERLDEMISWRFGIEHDFAVSAGKMGKYFKKYLPEPYWELYEHTYSDHHYDHFWDAIFAACDLFRAAGKDVAEHLQYAYPAEDDSNMTAYLKHVKKLPADARDIF
ncbi:aminoglycoside 6-adenylyltransferase [Heyndrickxia acidicola]|uniref:Aminoglycoside 6-adenylyltransferase n=1 Tax=Heyndrickxia acidicola TaxID=209389 RepID=A0ABU6MF78_9BACI|nr:aminoglycoside 6-adenylyltransferase [Heyndrickxia acidicola]MED1203311.1 aminoglycoside 6-adenylyltransferase [Heyndrickxia acidicola]